MQDEERLATLGELERARLALLQSLASLPFLIDTPTLEARKANLEVTQTLPTRLLHLPAHLESAMRIPPAPSPSCSLLARMHTGPRRPSHAARLPSRTACSRSTAPSRSTRAGGSSSTPEPPRPRARARARGA